MPKRMLDDSLLTSPSVAACSPRAQDAFPRLILLADDFGCVDANPRVLVGRGWPLRPDVTEQDMAGWLEEFERAGMIERWEEDGRRWLFLKGWDGPHGQRQRGEYHPTENPKGSKRHATPPSKNPNNNQSRGGTAAGNPVSRSVPAPAVAVSDAVADAYALPLVAEPDGSDDPGPLGKVIEVWSTTCVPAGFAKAHNTPQQRKAARARMREAGWFEAFQAACAYVATEPFYRGASSSGWVLTLGWLLKPGNAEKTAERAGTRRATGPPANGVSKPVTAPAAPQSAFTKGGRVAL